MKSSVNENVFCVREENQQRKKRQIDAQSSFHSKANHFKRETLQAVCGFTKNSRFICQYLYHSTIDVAQA